MPLSLTLNWRTCGDDRHWCHLSKLKLDSIRTDSGVYVIWKPDDTGNEPNVVRVGKGNIADRINEHQNDDSITRHGDNLLVTWAPVEVRYQDGVERFLAEELHPLEGVRHPEADPIPVNLPGA